MSTAMFETSAILAKYPTKPNVFKVLIQMCNISSPTMYILSLNVLKKWENIFLVYLKYYIFLFCRFVGIQ